MKNIARKTSLANVLHIITLLLVYVMSATVTNGQLILRQDGTQNSYSVAAPGSQITFSRFYGGQGGQLLSQQTQQQQQVQPTQASSHFLGQGQVYEQGNQLQYAASPSPAPVFYSPNEQQSQQLNPFVNNNLQTLDLLRQQYQQQHQQQNQVLQYQQQQQQLQQQQQQQEVLRQQHQQARHHNLVAEQHVRAQNNPFGQDLNQNQQQSTPENQKQLLGTLFSPSNEVSQVKFSSTGLNYSF